MIHGYATLRRQLRTFVDSLGIQWDERMLRVERDDLGIPLRVDERVECAFKVHGKLVEMAIFAPSVDCEHKPDGKNVLPLGKVAARINGTVIAGPIDQSTWASIRNAINGR